MNGIIQKLAFEGADISEYGDIEELTFSDVLPQRWGNVHLGLTTGDNKIALSVKSAKVYGDYAFDFVNVAKPKLSPDNFLYANISPSSIEAGLRITSFDGSQDYNFGQITLEATVICLACKQTMITTVNSYFYFRQNYIITQKI